MKKEFICPTPMNWADIHGFLLDAKKMLKRRIPDPPKPLVLGGWTASDSLKKVRWDQTVEWAQKYGFENLIPRLKEKDCYFRYVKSLNKNQKQGEFMTGINKSITDILMHKASLLKKSSRYRLYLKKLLKELEVNNKIDACILGAIDAMIYDIACSLDFTKQKGRVQDWSSYKLRRQLIKKAWSL